ncbi:MAG: MarR family winged helix-turn-helix transcriptional regulator [Leifsonia flava]
MATQATQGATSSGDASPAVARIRDELTTATRRGSARARRTHPSLSLVDQSLLNYIEANPGARGVDIAGHFQLHKSTVSRQLKILFELGLVQFAPDAADPSAGAQASRGQAIELTASGRILQAESSAELLAALTERLAHWDASDLETFAALLARYNSGT